MELVSPAALLDELPLGEEREQAVVRGRGEVGDVLDGSDDRLLVVVGPCSVHDVEAALDYAGRLAEQARELQRATCWSRCGSTSRSRGRRPAGRA